MKKNLYLFLLLVLIGTLPFSCAKGPDKETESRKEAGSVDAVKETGGSDAEAGKEAESKPRVKYYDLGTAETEVNVTELDIGVPFYPEADMESGTRRISPDGAEVYHVILRTTAPYVAVRAFYQENVGETKKDKELRAHGQINQFMYAWTEEKIYYAVRIINDKKLESVKVDIMKAIRK